MFLETTEKLLIMLLNHLIYPHNVFWIIFKKNDVDPNTNSYIKINPSGPGGISGPESNQKSGCC